MQDSLPTSTGTRTRVRPPNVRPMPADTAVHSGFVIVRLREGLAAADGDTLMDVARRLQLSGLVAALDAFDLSSARRTIRSLKPQQILELERKSASTEFPPLHSLTSYWRIDMRSQPERIDDVIKRLSALPEVDRAYRELATSEPLVNDADDDYAADQDYLDAAPAGIDARWAWTQPNSEGAGVGFIDLEQGWFANHEDLLGKAPALIYGDNRDGVGTYKGNHGTAVLGEVVGIDNAVGIVGIAPAVTSVRMVSHYDADTDTALHVADAIAAAIVAMHPGDVLLLEVQRGVGQPTESDDNDFDALRLAVANGIIVVEAAGNGGVNLDTYTDGGLQVLNRGSADFRDSGAIMVGAAEALVPHDRANYSCFGSRIDCSSPDVILRPVVVADPNAEFGEGSGNENSMTLGYEAEAGQDNYIYVRVRNRGSSDAIGVTATIYWSEVATLVTPASWHVIGTTPPVNVPQGDTLVVVGPLTWPAGQIPATGHYCFVGLLHHAQDPAPPIPGPSDWNGFTGMIRNQNNVTWRNFNVVDEIPDPDADPAALPFVIVAAPDRAREFELQILRNLPRDARVRLEVPLGLAAKLKRGRLWKVEVDRKRRCAIIDLPPLPRLDFGNIRLGAAARFKASNRSRSASRRIRACPRHTAANGHRPPRPNTGDDMRDRLSRLRRSRQFVRVYGLVSRRPSALQNL